MVDMDGLQDIARRGMRGNVEFVKLIQDQVQAHRLAAAASTLPRVRLHLCALADSLEALLGTSEIPPAAAQV
jgi:hypothetical protein